MAPAAIAPLPSTLSRDDNERIASTDIHPSTETPTISTWSDADCSLMRTVSDAPVPAAELENATARRDAKEIKFGQSDASTHSGSERKGLPG